MFYFILCSIIYKSVKQWNRKAFFVRDRITIAQQRYSPSPLPARSNPFCCLLGVRSPYHSRKACTRALCNACVWMNAGTPHLARGRPDTSRYKHLTQTLIVFWLACLIFGSTLPDTNTISSNTSKWFAFVCTKGETLANCPLLFIYTHRSRLVAWKHGNMNQKHTHTQTPSQRGRTKHSSAISFQQSPPFLSSYSAIRKSTRFGCSANNCQSSDSFFGYAETRRLDKKNLQVFSNGSDNAKIKPHRFENLILIKVLLFMAKGVWCGKH